MQKTNWTVAVLVTSCVAAVQVRADDRTNQAMALGRAGEELFLAGRYDQALERFRELVRRFDGPPELLDATRWNIARCHEEMGNDVAALEAFVDYAKHARLDDEKSDVFQKLRTLRERVKATLRLTVEPAGAVIQIDGQKLGTAPWTAPVPLAYGRHVVVVSKEGHRTVERTLDLGPKEARDLAIVLQAVVGEIEVSAGEAQIESVLVRVGGKEVHRGGLPARIQVGGGRQKVSVTVPGGRQRWNQVVQVGDGDVVPVVLATRPRDTESRSAKVGGQVALSLGEGFVVDQGAARRTHVTLELLGGIRPVALQWLQVELGLAVSVEAPAMVLLRPGVRLYAGKWPIFGRIGAQLMATSPASAGLILGAGGEIPIGRHWRIPLGLDVNLWPSAVRVVPVEFRAGVAYVF